MIHEAMAAIAQCLQRAEIPYMVIGGQAVLQYGRLRATEDIDVTIGLATAHVRDLEKALGTEFLVTPQKPQEFADATGVLPVVHKSSNVRLDLIFGQTGFEADAIGRAFPIEINGVRVHFTSPEDLIIQKLFAGRSVDITDAEAIYAHQKDKLDTGHIMRVLSELDAVMSQTICAERWRQLHTSE